MESLKPLKDKIIVSRIAGEKTTSAGIILKSSEGPDRALVEAIGPKVDEVSVGDEVLINWNGAVPVKDKALKIFPDSDEIIRNL